MGRADRTAEPMNRTRLAVLTALLSLACAGPAAAAQRFGIDVSTTLAPGSPLTAGKAAGTYDLAVVNGGPAASVTIQGPGVARVVFLPKQEFRSSRCTRRRATGRDGGGPAAGARRRRPLGSTP